MYVKSTKGDVMNSSNLLHLEIRKVKNELKKLQKEEFDFNLLMKEKQEVLRNKMNEIIINDFPIKKGDKIITKKEYQYWLVEKTGKTDRSIKYKEIHKDYVKGVVDRIIPQGELGNCRIILDLQYQENITNEIRNTGFDNTNVSLDKFNELYQVVKN